jgi:hypothetical protein
MEVSGQHHAPAALPGEITPAPIEYEAGWASELLWKVLEKTEFFPLPVFESRPVQFVASRCTN